MIFQPRGSAKSTNASIIFPSKYLGETPDRKLILASYGDELPKQHGRRTRSIVRQKRYQQIFHSELSNDSSAGDHFRLTNGSEYYATGMGAAVVGHRAHGILIDDPVKNVQDARSETKRNSTWESYCYDLRPCLIPHGFIVLIMTRWDPDDIAGRILPEDWNGDSGYFQGRDGMRWRVLCLQARCETHTDPLGRKLGEYLCPEWFPISQWQEYERNRMQWAAMCQQIPRPPEGAFFLKDSLLVDGIAADGSAIRVPAEMPTCVTVVFCTIDTAIKTGKEHDGTGVIYWGLMPNDFGGGYKLVILDWDYVQIEGGTLEKWLPEIFARLEELARECMATMGSNGAWIEDKGSGIVLLQQAQNHGWPAQAIDTKLVAMGKTERAYNAEPYVSAGDVKICRPAYEKVVTFKGSTKNHLLSQVLNFSMDSKDQDAKDLLDCLTYGVAISIGNPEGF